SGRPTCILPSPQCYNSAAKTLSTFLHRRHRMYRRVLTLLTIAPELCISTLALRECAIAQEHAQHTAAAKAKPATLMTGYGDWHHPVSTNNAQAQAFFDQGLPLICAFNQD